MVLFKTNKGLINNKLLNFLLKKGITVYSPLTGCSYIFETTILKVGAKRSPSA